MEYTILYIPVYWKALSLVRVHVHRNKFWRILYSYKLHNFYREDGKFNFQLTMACCATWCNKLRLKTTMTYFKQVTSSYVFCILNNPVQQTAVKQKYLATKSTSQPHGRRKENEEHANLMNATIPSKCKIIRFVCVLDCNSQKIISSTNRTMLVWRKCPQLS